jgi:hypothetical protein
MTVAPVGAVGSEAANAIKQMAESAMKQSASMDNSAIQMPANTEMTTGPASSPTGTDFAGSVMDTVYTEIDKLAQNLPKVSSSDGAVSDAKSSMAASGESINPTAEGSLKSDKHEAVEALSKTFDHAIFMTMVNQVISGVSDTSRTLIRQS